MKWLKIKLFFIVLFIGSFAVANDLFFVTKKDSVAKVDSMNTQQVKGKRAKAIIFTLLTGPLGGHRIYLQTHHKVPILYSVTLGGFGIVAITDLCFIIFKKDLSPFENNDRFIMWNNKSKK